MVTVVMVVDVEVEEGLSCWYCLLLWRSGHRPTVARSEGVDQGRSRLPSNSPAWQVRHYSHHIISCLVIIIMQCCQSWSHRKSSHHPPPCSGPRLRREGGFLSQFSQKLKLNFVFWPLNISACLTGAMINSWETKWKMVLWILLGRIHQFKLFRPFIS